MDQFRHLRQQRRIRHDMHHAAIPGDGQTVAREYLFSHREQFVGRERRSGAKGHEIGARRHRLIRLHVQFEGLREHLVDENGKSNLVQRQRLGLRSLGQRRPAGARRLDAYRRRGRCGSQLGSAPALSLGSHHQRTAGRRLESAFGGECRGDIQRRWRCGRRRLLLAAGQQQYRRHADRTVARRPRNPACLGLLIEQFVDALCRGTRPALYHG